MDPLAPRCLTGDLAAMTSFLALYHTPANLEEAGAGRFMLDLSLDSDIATARNSVLVIGGGWRCWNGR